MSTDDAARLCNAFTLDGKTPEPVRAAQLLARAVLHCEKEVSERNPTTFT
ncbi:MAG TPA: hypothetical protein VE134_08205 [Methanomicrobiales archaeon]|nr:hypothetical protein [Methanomicrobiales archaeon]